MLFQRITVVKIRRPKENTINENLQWFGNSLGLFSLRDKDRSCFRIFIELVKAAKKGRMLSSDELAYLSKLSRGTVVHHLNRLMESGIIIGNRNGYVLRVENLKQLTDELLRDIENTIKELKEAASEIDENLGI